ncbi:putative deoxyribonuclease TATDN2 [Diadema setosum]|uniref:putative deoxyribonuclease TATDN2 n=1 Tax=Diadema setosum TaxID=31175 RepID=UPI003B3A08C7
MQKHCPPDTGIHLHCCTGSLAQVQRWMEAFPECYFGYTMAIAQMAFPAQQALWTLPLQQLLLEADAPHLKPPSATRCNAPSYLGKVAKAVAMIRGEPMELICEAATENARRLYRM